MEKWDSYSVVIEDAGMFPLSYSFCGSDVMIVDVESEKFGVVETWVRHCHPGKWREVMDHFVAGYKLNTYENDGRMRIEKLSGNVYRVTMEKKIRNVERACVECKHYVKGWDRDIGPCSMCRRLQFEEDDLIFGGKKLVGPVLRCDEERGIIEMQKLCRMYHMDKYWWVLLVLIHNWKRLWIGSNICGKEGKYWVEK